MASDKQLLVFLIFIHSCFTQKISVKIGDTTHIPPDVYFVELELFDIIANPWCGDYITNMQLYRNNQWWNASTINSNNQYPFMAVGTGGGQYSAPIVSRMITVCGSVIDLPQLDSLVRDTAQTSIFQLCDDQTGVCFTPSQTTLNPTYIPTYIPTYNPTQTPTISGTDNEYSVVIEITNADQLSAQDVDIIIGDILSLHSNITSVNVESIHSDIIKLIVKSNGELDTDKIEENIIDELDDKYPNIKVSVEKNVDKNKKNNDSNDMPIIIIVIIVIIFILLLFVACLLYIVWKQKQKQNNKNKNMCMDGDDDADQETNIIDDVMNDTVVTEMGVNEKDATDEEGEELYTNVNSENNETAGNTNNNNIQKETLQGIS